MDIYKCCYLIYSSLTIIQFKTRVKFLSFEVKKRNKEKIMIEPIALLVCDRFIHMLAAGYLNMAQTYI